MPRAALLVALALGLAACAARPPEAEGDEALADLWAAVPVGQARLDRLDVPSVCGGRFGTWFSDFGVRGLACSVDQVLPLAEVAARSPGRVWVGGPHRSPEAGLRLALDAPRAFGQYDPAAVRWAGRNAVPEDRAARTLAQPVYDAHVRRLARVYWESYRALAEDGFPDTLPPGPARAYAAYLDGGPVPPGAASDDGVSMFLLFDEVSRPIASAVAGPADNEWEVSYEANTALGFWVRRRADGTAGAFHDGLRRVLAAFDAGWLTAHDA